MNIQSIRQLILTVGAFLLLAPVLYLAPAQFTPENAAHAYEAQNCKDYADFGVAVPRDVAWCLVPVSNKQGCVARWEPEMAAYFFRHYLEYDADIPVSAKLLGNCINGQIHGDAILAFTFDDGPRELSVYRIVVDGTFVNGVKHGEFVITSYLTYYTGYSPLDGKPAYKIESSKVVYKHEGAYVNGYKDGKWLRGEDGKRRLLSIYSDGRVLDADGRVLGLDESFSNKRLVCFNRECKHLRD